MIQNSEFGCIYKLLSKFQVVVVNDIFPYMLMFDDYCFRTLKSCLLAYMQNVYSFTSRIWNNWKFLYPFPESYSRHFIKIILNHNLMKVWHIKAQMSYGVLYNIVLDLHFETKRRQFWFCCHMLSGDCQAGPYNTNMTAKPKLIIGRNIEKTNQTDGFKMTALEKILCNMGLPLISWR